MTLSVLILGSDSDEALENSYARAFRHIECTVDVWDPIFELHKLVRGKKLGQLFSTFVHVEPWLRKANVELLRIVDRLRPDLILVIGTSGVRGGTLAQVRVLSPKTLIYCIFPDSPHNLDSDRIHCLPFFDRLTTSSPAWVQSFQELGARRVHYLPFAADTALHFPTTDGSANPPLKHDIVFIGTWRPERETVLEGLVEFDLCIWGNNYWKTRTRTGSPLRNRWGGRSISGKEFSRVCAESRILLNIMDPITWPGPNMRTFEQPACQVFSLVSRSQPILDIFTEGETIECFESIEEAKVKIRYYLDHDHARQRIAAASYRLVVSSGHTYIDRARILLQWAAEDQIE